MSMLTQRSGLGVHTRSALGVRSKNPLKLVSISPNSKTQGSSTFTMTLIGAGFTPTSIVKWSGETDLTPVFIDANTLTVTVPSAYIVAVATANITVVNTGGSASNAKVFTTVTAYKFIVYAPFSITRGVPFNAFIQSVLIVDNSVDASYTPASSVAISITGGDALDTIAPATTGNTGWVSGGKMVSVTITGGSIKNKSITINASGDNRLGAADVWVPLTTTLVATGGSGIYGGYGGGFTFPVGSHSADCTNRQNLNQTIFNGNNWVFGSSNNAYKLYVNNYLSGSYVRDADSYGVLCGYVLPSLVGLKKASIVLSALVYNETYLNGIATGSFAYSEQAPQFNLSLVSSVSSSIYEPGAALVAAPFEQVLSFSDLNIKAQIAQGSLSIPNLVGGGLGLPVVAKFEIPLDISKLLAAGSSIYYWFYISGLISFSSFLAANVDTTGNQYNAVCAFAGRASGDLQLKLYF